ncbi:DUF6541 family protein [Agromyces sp. Marseille-P2726]|uniref:DUF6541 family protein n=1 Tax=Agromyces sp. Marseille-P2726 TaxID=2709132 RepID=UPI0015709A51|nr:DUF6541 family protein [Agromyces sp. Marseille-P2726]
MSWLELVPALLTTIAWLVLPGALVLWLVDVRGLVLLAGSAPLSVAFFGVLAIAYGAIGIPWSTLSVAAAVAVVVIVLLAIRLLLRRRWRFPARRASGEAQPAWHLIGAWALAALTIAVQVMISLGAPDAISQTFDNGFHLGAVRYILDTGNASSFAISGVTGGTGVYPAAWHDLTALVVSSAGGSLPAAANAVSLVVSGLVWPGGVLVLARVVAPRHPSALWIAAVLSALLPWFPLLPLTFGVLFPFFLAVAFLPLAIALVVSVLGKAGSLGLPLATRILLLVAVIAAMGLAQPSVVFGLVAAALPVAASAVIGLFRRTRRTTQRITIVALALAALAALAVVWRQAGAIGYTAPWGPEGDLAEGAYDVLLFSIDDGPPALGLAILVVVGVIRSALRPGRRWVAGMWLVGALLYYAAVVLPVSDLRNILLGVFYKDPPRLASLFMVLALPAAITGGLFVWERLREWIARVPALARVRPAPIVGAVVAVVAVGGLQAPAVGSAVANARAVYELNEFSPIITADELALIERLPETTGLEGVAAGNPWTGSSLAYALVGQHVLNPHFNTAYLPERTVVNTQLNEAGSDAAVCDAVRDLDVRWVLDFGTYFRDAADELHFDSTVGYEGLLDLADTPGFVEVDREGEDAVLYRVDACG